MIHIWYSVASYGVLVYLDMYLHRRIGTWNLVSWSCSVKCIRNGVAPRKPRFYFFYKNALETPIRFIFIYLDLVANKRSLDSGVYWVQSRIDYTSLYLYIFGNQLIKGNLNQYPCTLYFLPSLIIA